MNMVIKIFIKNEGDFKSNTNILQRQFFFYLVTFISI